MANWFSGLCSTRSCPCQGHDHSSQTVPSQHCAQTAQVLSTGESSWGHRQTPTQGRGLRGSRWKETPPLRLGRRTHEVWQHRKGTVISLPYNKIKSDSKAPEKNFSVALTGHMQPFLSRFQLKPSARLPVSYKISSTETVSSATTRTLEYRL